MKKRAKMAGNKKILIIGATAAALGLLGYAWWRSRQAASAISAPASAPSQPTAPVAATAAKFSGGTVIEATTGIDDIQASPYHNMSGATSFVVDGVKSLVTKTMTAIGHWLS